RLRQPSGLSRRNDDGPVLPLGENGAVQAPQASVPAVRGAEAALALQAAPAGLGAASVGLDVLRRGGRGAGEEDGRDGGDFLGLGVALLDANVRGVHRSQ